MLSYVTSVLLARIETDHVTGLLMLLPRGGGGGTPANFG